MRHGHSLQSSISALDGPAVRPKPEHRHLTCLRQLLCCLPTQSPSQKVYIIDLGLEQQHRQLCKQRKQLITVGEGRGGANLAEES